jgi:hypothetical protein
MGDTQKKLQALSDNYQTLQAGAKLQQFGEQLLMVG